MFKHIIFIFILLALIGFGLLPAAATFGAGIPDYTGVVKPPDTGALTRFTPPAITSPVLPDSPAGPVSGQPVSRP